MKLCLILALAAAIAAPASAASINATPETAATVFAKAQGGDTVVLGRGHYVGAKGLSNRTFDPPLKIDARAAALERWAISKVQGLEINGGTWRNGCLPAACYNYALRFDGGARIKVLAGAFIGPEVAEPGVAYQRADGYGVGFIGTTDVELVGNAFVNFKTGAVLNKVSRFKVAGNRFNRMRSDGLAIGQGWVGLIEGNICDGTRTLSTEHPDCIQLWSRPDAPPTSDIAIRRNLAVGEMQGVFLGNHVRAGVDDGGFDRVHIEENDVWGAYPNGVALYAGRASTVRNNRTRTVPGAPYIVRVITTGDVQRCGNTAEAGAGKKAQADAPCGSLADVSEAGRRNIPWPDQGGTGRIPMTANAAPAPQ